MLRYENWICKSPLPLPLGEVAAARLTERAEEKMAFKQPRVPQESGRLAEYVRNLGMFLRDFCMASWNADRMKDAEIEKIKKRLDALEGK